ncbi:PucR family transcriptional regulator [Actinoallomurus rhizosphaericola]|uniref:PucR family transcriptional regulator n=1 Tax=Actinoallomurus rhizosphaericola TaxID=2952536 RepID=UPI00209388F5|nr:PucR family transcriptional regulator [Actinoallomurus rhizosphaericola]MCO5995247.1 PucR family transcriptional regulator [Actinoallomurus rhizosphaericola]
MSEQTPTPAARGPRSTAARLTVRDVLSLDLVATWGPEVVAGTAHLDRPVRWLHVAEATDVAVMLAGGEMVLTTGLLLAGNDQAQAEYIESMRRVGVAAVVLGLGRAFRTTPEPMRRAAQRCGMPLIVLHRPAPFVRMTEEVHSRLLSGRFAALDLSDNIRSSLTALNLSGATLQQLLDEIACYSGCPVVLVNLAQRVLASAGDRAPLSELLRDWDRVSRQVAELAGSGPVTVEPDGWIVVDLEARGRRWGRLVLFGYAGSEEFGLLLGARAAEALAMHRLLGDRDRGWEEQAAESLLLDLASGAARPEQLFTRVRAAGLPVDRRTFVPLVVRVLDDGRADGERRNGERGDTPELVDRAVAETPEVAGLVARIEPEGTAVLLSIPYGEDAGAVLRRVAVRVREALALRGRRAVIGAGFACSVLDEVRRSFVEAVHVADAAVAAPPDGPVARLGDVRLRGLVRLLRDDPELQAFIGRELGPLLENPSLLGVLRTYMETGRNKSLAAQALHVSRPTLYRRLQRIEALLGIDLEDWERLTSLYVALLAHEGQTGPRPAPPGSAPERP